MYKTFKPNISADFLKTMEDSLLVKALIERAGISAFKMLSRFTLTLPFASNPADWLVESDVSLPNQLPDIILFLKYAWLYSEREQNEHVDRLRKSVSDEVTSFEKDLLIENEQKKQRATAKLLRNREEEIRTAEEELIRSQLQLKSQNSQIKQQKKDLKGIQKELEIKRQKERESSIRHSEAASKPRSCEELNEYLEDLVTNNPGKLPGELWALIPRERDGSDVYKENNKICHEGCRCKPFGKKAFTQGFKKSMKN